MGSEHDHLADNIKAVREARGLSQQQIAKAAGIPRATWTHLESGAANPTLAVLVKGDARERDGDAPPLLCHLAPRVRVRRAGRGTSAESPPS